MSHSDDPSLWLRYAKDDLDVARADVALHLRCYHAQQAAEKAIKAVLVHHDIDFPWVHELSHLAALLPPRDHAQVVDDAAELSAYASAARYPKRTATYTPAQTGEAGDLASAVVTWASGIIEPA